jgi:hypothetical protein
LMLVFVGFTFLNFCLSFIGKDFAAVASFFFAWIVIFLTLDEIEFFSFFVFFVFLLSFVGIKLLWWSIWSNARHRSRSWSLIATKSRVLVACWVVFFFFIDFFVCNFSFFSDLSFFNFARSSFVNNFGLSKWL